MRVHDPDNAALRLSPLTDARSLREVLLKHFRSGKHEVDYDCVVLDTVDRDSKLKPTTRRMPGLMRYHDFVFDSATQITVKELNL